MLADDLGLELVPDLGNPTPRSMFENRTAAILKGHASAVRVASFSPDGRRLVTASGDRIIEFSSLSDWALPFR